MPAGKCPLPGRCPGVQGTWRERCSGAAGNAAAASSAKGHALINAAGLQLARLVQELSALPIATLNPEPDLRD